MLLSDPQQRTLYCDYCCLIHNNIHCIVIIVVWSTTTYIVSWLLLSDPQQHTLYRDYCCLIHNNVHCIVIIVVWSTTTYIVLWLNVHMCKWQYIYRIYIQCTGFFYTCICQTAIAIYRHVLYLYLSRGHYIHVPVIIISLEKLF
jgi:hypothetical protein